METVRIPVMHCKWCGYDWIARKPEKPKYCPKCKSPTDREPIKREARQLAAPGLHGRRHAMNDIPTHVNNCTTAQDKQPSSQVFTPTLTLSIPQAAVCLGISASLCYQLARKNELPGVIRLGSRYVVSRYQLERYINGSAANDNSNLT